ncbi:CIS tube protein [Glaciimonas sp. GG7]
MAGSLEHMVISAFSDEQYTSPVGTPFTVWINPASYTRDRNISYVDRQAPGSSGNSPEFNKVGQESISFDLMFDATGVIPPPIPGTPLPSDGVAGLIATFTAMTINVNGNIHRPNFLKLSWAQLQFQCVLTKLNITYTLFKPNGTPLRARLAVTFLSFKSEKQIELEANKKSPDMTHLVTVLAGDTLPGLCHRIYGNSGYYLKVAKFNNVLNFRQLRPGTQLVFPPLSGTQT